MPPSVFLSLIENVERVLQPTLTGLRAGLETYLGRAEE